MEKFVFDTSELHNFEMNANSFKIAGRMVNKVTTIHKPKKNAVIYINNISRVHASHLNNLKDCLIITDSDFGLGSNVINNNDFIISHNPRLTYAIVLQFILRRNSYFERKKYNNIGDNIYFGDNVTIGEEVHIEPNVTIGNNVEIGTNTVVLSGVRIGDDVVIGSNSVIRNNTVVGGWGFGIEKDKSGKTYRIPHLGSVIVGDNVDVGSLNTVVSGTIEPTIVENNVMTDDHVHIAHNCYIGEGTQITACVEISGSVRIGRDSTLGPNCSVMNKISLGENTIVGLGAVVTKSFGDDVVLAGNPADIIENLKHDRNIIRKVIEGHKHLK